MMLLLDDLGAIAQLGRAAGWSPVCRRFDSTLRHYFDYYQGRKKMNKKGINLKDIFDINKIKFTKKELELPYQNYKK